MTDLLTTGLGALGAVGVGLGGFLSAGSQRKAASKERKMLQQFVQGTQAQMTRAQQLEMEAALKAERQATKQASIDLQRANQRADADLFNLMANPDYRAQASFLRDMFQQGIPETLKQTYAGNLRQAQAARGLEGSALARDEAALLTNLQYQAQMQMLPQIRQLAFDPLQVRQQAAQTELQMRGAAQQLGLAQLQAALQTRQAGISAATSKVMPMAELAASVLTRTPYSAANPLANAMGAWGQGMLSMAAMAGGGGGAARNQTALNNFLTV